MRTVHRWFLRLSQAGVFECLAHALTMANRERVGREASPTGCVVDAQAARSGGVGMAGERGYDPARRAVGRKRHALTDTDGRLLVAGVSCQRAPKSGSSAIRVARNTRSGRGEGALA